MIPMILVIPTRATGTVFPRSKRTSYALLIAQDDGVGAQREAIDMRNVHNYDRIAGRGPGERYTSTIARRARSPVSGN